MTVADHSASHSDQGSGPEDGPDRNAAGMMADVVTGVIRLVQGEIALAKAEAAERVRWVQRAALQAGLALVLGITAVNVLAAAAVAGVAHLGLGPAWASVVVGGVLLLMTIGIALHATRLLRDASSLSRHYGSSAKSETDT